MKRSAIETIKKETQKRQPTKWGGIEVQNIFYLENTLGTKFFKKRINSKHRNKYLNLGCGGDEFKGWVNADLYTFHNLITGRRALPNWMLDATKPWNCPDDFWSGIYCSHMIEHIKYIEVINVFKEAYRTLQSGKWMRIAVPDLNKYIEYYNGEPSETGFQQYAAYKAFAISDLTQNWGHVSTWDEALLVDLLQELDFINVKKTKYQEGSDENLLQDVLSPDRRWESLYVEAQKP